MLKWQHACTWPRGSYHFCDGHRRVRFGQHHTPKEMESRQGFGILTELVIIRITWRPRMYRLTFLWQAALGVESVWPELSPSRLLWFHWWCSVFCCNLRPCWYDMLAPLEWVQVRFWKAQVVVIKTRCLFRIWWPGVPVFNIFLIFFNELFNANLTYICAARCEHSVSAGQLR